MEVEQTSHLAISSTLITRVPPEEPANFMEDTGSGYTVSIEAVINPHQFVPMEEHSWSPIQDNGNHLSTGQEEGHPLNTDLEEGHPLSTGLGKGHPLSTIMEKGHPLSTGLEKGHPLSPVRKPQSTGLGVYWSQPPTEGGHVEYKDGSVSHSVPSHCFLPNEGGVVFAHGLEEVTILEPHN